MKVTDEQVRQMCAFVERNEGDGCCEWGREGVAVRALENGRKRRGIAKKEESTGEKKQRKVRESKYKALQCLSNYDPNKMHEFYKQPHEIVEIVRKIAKISKLS